MKKMIAILMTFLLLLPAVALAQFDLSQMSLDDLQELQTEVADEIMRRKMDAENETCLRFDDMYESTLEITGYEFTELNGEPILSINVIFTNFSATSRTLGYDFFAVPVQSGKECRWYNDFDSAHTSVKDGASVQGTFGIFLNGSDDIVEVGFRENGGSAQKRYYSSSEDTVD